MTACMRAFPGLVRYAPNRASAAAVRARDRPAARDNLPAFRPRGPHHYLPPPAMKATDIRRGHVIVLDGQPCRVMEFTHRTPGNLRAFVQVRLRNLLSGNTFDTRLPATDFVDEA